MSDRADSAAVSLLSDIGHRGRRAHRVRLTPGCAVKLAMLARCSRFSSVSDAASSNQVTTPRRRDRSGPRSAICLRCERRDLFNLCGSVALWQKEGPEGGANREHFHVFG